MNCFEWQSRSADYLDGTLIGAAKHEADAHLDGCPSCGERYKHYRVILTSIANQPRSSLPVPIRKAPLTAALPRLDITRIGRTRWEHVPWYLRTAIEGASIVLLILVGISTGPKIRALAERNMERSLSEFSEPMSDGSQPGAATPQAQVPDATLGTAATAETAANAPKADEFTGGETGEDDSAGTDEGDETRDDDGVRVGKSEIWRFNLKTDSPDEIRPKIVQALSSLGVRTETPGLGGIKAPGGIQFDLLLPQASVATLKRQLVKLAPRSPEALAGSPVGETFTWYKNKSKNPIPAGKTRVVIWISQI